jgi:hypothetical protein
MNNASVCYRIRLPEQVRGYFQRNKSPTVLPIRFQYHSLGATQPAVLFDDLPQCKKINAALILVLHVLTGGARLKKAYCCQSLTLPASGGSGVDPKSRA